MKKEWESRKESFPSLDFRKATENFLPGLLKRAAATSKGEGFRIIQTFEPLPLYSALGEMGFEHLTEKVTDQEYHVWFCRTEERDPTYAEAGDLPLKPTAILNFKKISDNMAGLAVNFWQEIWNKETPALDLKTKLLLSLANGVGAGRFRQATRELIKAYALGLTIPEMDEMFSLFAWNGGMGTFASEIGPSPLFGAYQLIKEMEGRKQGHSAIMKALLEKFGESNSQVSVAQR
jgi:alkylhydroperoxidase/carboxymuconolactone decarboxylase family protein YurZ